MTEWYRKSIAETTQSLGVTVSQGLTEEEVRQRQEQYGPNELVEKGQKSPLRILLEQFTGIMTIILLFSAAVSIYLDEWSDAIVILAIVVLNAILGFTQEYRAERAMAALKQMAVPVVKARRGGSLREISARELVPGDVIIVEAGNSIPADARLLESVNLQAQEAVLTGESVPVEKSTEPFDRPDLPLGDRRNMLYMGTIVSFGRGSAIVTDTGMRTELGRIAELIQGVGSERTPLQRRLEQLGKGLAMAALGIVLVVFLLGLWRGQDLSTLIRTAISMAVAAVPEGLPTVVTIALALGAQRMLARRALIRKLPAVETLGSVTVICSDKTGTLTQNQMTVTYIDVAGHQMDLTERLHTANSALSKGEPDEQLAQQPQPIPQLLAMAALCNDATLERSREGDSGPAVRTVGDPTEAALVLAAAWAGLQKRELEQQLPRIGELPFDSDRKRMSTVHAPDGSVPEVMAPVWQWVEANQPASRAQGLVITKGAVDSMLEVADRVWTNSGTEPLNDHWRQRIAEANNQLAARGMRVLGIAFRALEAGESRSGSGLENNLIFLGMTGMIDPARPEVRDAVATAKRAGIYPIMITGDHPLTAMSIAKELGIARSDRAITGQELAQMSVDELRGVVEDVSVYARVSPEHKLKIVEALQSRGHIVSMTGDGVNDAPALKKADIGVAMGITGTDVSKEASDMVLLDDNFATIVAAVEEGRRIYDNIRKFVRYALTSNSGEIWIMLLAPIINMPFPLAPLQILWVNLVTDGLPGLALTQEPAEHDTMRRKPYPPQENIFARGLGVDIIWIGALIGILSLGLGYWFWSTGRETWQTMVFTTITLAQMGNVFASRSERESLFSLGVFTNPALIGAVILTIILQLAVVYVPFLQGFFDTQPLSGSDLALSFGAAILVFIIIEVVKALRRGFRKGENP